MSVLERVIAAGVENSSVQSSGQQLSQTELKSRMKERLKHDVTQKMGLKALAALAMDKDAIKAREELAVAIRALLNQEAYAGLLERERQELIALLQDEVIGLGPIQRLLDDPEITEVMVNGPKKLFYEKAGKLHISNRVFENEEQILMIIDRILAPLGRRLDRASPLVNARLANGDRVNAVAQPIAIDGPSITIRKFSNRITSIERLVELGSVVAWYAKLLSWAVAARQDIAVAGGTGSGKTTLLNALSCEIDPGERIVTIEDSAELSFAKHPNVVRLEARDASIEGTGEVTIRDLVKNALRMRPDRIVVGECRGEEAIDMLQAMNTGHDGSLTTLHAGTAHEAILRLVLMARFGMDLPADLIEEQVATALDLLVMSVRLSDGSRFISSLHEVRRNVDGGVELVECVVFNELTRTWNLVREPQFLKDVQEKNLISEKEYIAWKQSLTH